MELRELANALGVENYPAALEEIYKNLPMDDGLICNVEHITALNEKYELFIFLDGEELSARVYSAPSLVL